MTLASHIKGGVTDGEFNDGVAIVGTGDLNPRHLL